MAEINDGYNPLISVVLPTYNGEEFVEATLESVFCQRGVNTEIVIVDDASDDDTYDILKQYSSRRDVKLLRNAENCGLAPSTNKGVAHASGDILAFIDQDDVWKVNKLKRHLVHHQRGEAEIVYSAYTTIDQSGKRLRNPDVPVAKRDRELLRQFCQEGNLIKGGMSTVTVASEAWREVGGFDTDMKRLADLDLWIRMASRFRFTMLPERLVYKRVHNRNFSDDYRLTHRDYVAICDKIEERPNQVSKELLSQMRARIDYVRAVNALLADNPKESIKYSCNSYINDSRLKPVLLALLAGLNLCLGPFEIGSWIYETRDPFKWI